MSALVTVTGDGTFRAPARRPDTIGDAALEALHQLRSLLGDDLEEGVGTRLYLPAGLGTEPADHLLPSTLALLGTSGDLASYGWRIGPGTGRAWQRAHELAARMLEVARIALLGYEGPLALTVLGPLSLAAATFTSTGERTLADRGAMRDLPHLLAEGVAERIETLRDRVPGALAHVMIREDAIRAVHAGRIATASGYRRHAAVPAPEIGALWQSLLDALTAIGLAPTDVTLACSGDASLMLAAQHAGARRLALSPDSLGRLTDAQGRHAWETLAAAHGAGTGLEMVLDPHRRESQLRLLAEHWHELGFAPASLAGLTLLAHRTTVRADHAVDPAHGGGPTSDGVHADPAAQPPRSALLDEHDLTAMLRTAPAWAGRVTD